LVDTVIQTTAGSSVSAYTLTSVGEAIGIVRAIVGGCCGTDTRHVDALWN
jgi:methionine synthase I (cobalamin-dependent)